MTKSKSTKSAKETKVKLTKTEIKIEKLFTMASDTRGNNNENFVALSKAIDIINGDKKLGCQNFGMIENCLDCNSGIVQKVCEHVFKSALVSDDFESTKNDNSTQENDNEVLLLENKTAVNFTMGKTSLEIIDTAIKAYEISKKNKRQPYGAFVLLMMQGKKTKDIVNILCNGAGDKETKKVKGFGSKVSCVINTFNGAGSGKVYQACKAIVNGQAIPTDCKAFSTNIKGVYEFYNNEGFNVWVKNEKGRKMILKKAKNANKTKQIA